MAETGNVINLEKRFTQKSIWEEDFFLQAINTLELLDGAENVLDIGSDDDRCTDAIAELAENLVVEKRKWSDINLEKEGYHKKFDLVYCNLSGAIKSIDDLKKMNEASKHYCVLSDYISVKKPFEDEVEEFLFPYPIRKRTSKMSFFYSYLREKGYIPEADYYERDDTLEFNDNENAFRYFKNLMEQKYKLSDNDCERLGSFINASFYEGMLVNPIHSIIATLVWRVK